MSKITVEMMPPIKVFLADTHFLFIEGLSMMLSAIDGFRIAGMARTAPEALHQARHISSDVLLIDAGFFFPDYLKFSQDLRNTYAGKILVFQDTASVSCLKKIASQVDGFLSKTATGHQLYDSIRAVAEGRYTPKDKFTFAGIVNSPFRQELVNRFALTNREIEVIRLIALEFLSAEIAQKLCVSEFTVDTYRKNITKKLNARNVASIVNFAHRWQLV